MERFVRNKKLFEEIRNAENPSAEVRRRINDLIKRKELLALEETKRHLEELERKNKFELLYFFLEKIKELSNVSKKAAVEFLAYLPFLSRSLEMSDEELRERICEFLWNNYTSFCRSPELIGPTILGIHELSSFGLLGEALETCKDLPLDFSASILKRSPEIIGRWAEKRKVLKSLLASVEEVSKVKNPESYLSLALFVSKLAPNVDELVYALKLIRRWVLRFEIKNLKTIKRFGFREWLNFGELAFRFGINPEKAYMLTENWIMDKKFVSLLKGPIERAEKVIKEEAWKAMRSESLEFDPFLMDCVYFCILRMGVKPRIFHSFLSKLKSQKVFMGVEVLHRNLNPILVLERKGGRIGIIVETSKERIKGILERFSELIEKYRKFQEFVSSSELQELIRKGDFESALELAHEAISGVKIRFPREEWLLLSNLSNMYLVMRPEKHEGTVILYSGAPMTILLPLSVKEIDVEEAVKRFREGFYSMVVHEGYLAGYAYFKRVGNVLVLEEVWILEELDPRFMLYQISKGLIPLKDVGIEKIGFVETSGLNEGVKKVLENVSREMVPEKLKDRTLFTSDLEDFATKVSVLGRF